MFRANWGNDMNNQCDSALASSSIANLYSASTDIRMAHIAAGLKKRRAASRRLRIYGIAAILTALGFLFILLTTIISNGYTALQQTEIAVSIEIPAEEIIDEAAQSVLKNLEISIGVGCRSFRKIFRSNRMLDQRSLGELLGKSVTICVCKLKKLALLKLEQRSIG